MLDIHAMIKRLVRAVEAIPLHLTLAIVRLDDALGESWALPYQACQTLEVLDAPQRVSKGLRIILTGDSVLNKFSKTLSSRMADLAPGMSN